jgi:hypothetical protein
MTTFDFPLNYKVNCYLQLSNLSGVEATDYLIVYDQETGEASLSYWNIEKLGTQPTNNQLTEAAKVIQSNRLSVAYKLMAKKLLTDTDWTQYPDVNDTSVTPHLLNQEEFNTYRLVLRSIVVSPTSTVEIPLMPMAQWS